MPFQATVNTRPAPAVMGDWASDGPRFFYPAGPGGLVAGASGVTVGRFAWASPSSIDWDGGPTIVNSFGYGQVTGVVHRNQQALITTYLAESGLLIPQGFGLALCTGADIWLKNEGTNEAIPGNKAYASFLNGAATFAASGSPTTTSAGSGSSIAAASGQTLTGSISGNVLTVTDALSHTVVIGAILTGGSGMVTGTQIVAQLSGTAGGAGTYVVTPGEQTVASATLTQTYGTLTATGGTPTGIGLGSIIAGTGVTAGTYVTAFGTGTGGAGTYIVSPTQTASANAFTAQSMIETKWIAASSGLPGEVVRCLSQPLG